MSKPVLVACEESQAVCIALRNVGIEAYSCDIQECSGGHPEWHIRSDVFDAIESREWGGMIAFPPCKFLTNAGVRWLYNANGDMNHDRWNDMREGAEFFKRIMLSFIPIIAIENPIQHKYAREIIVKKPDQIIQPWMFGHGETKATCLWLKGLPPLISTEISTGREGRIHKLPPSPDRAKLRSKTFPGIAQAMADQWKSFFI